jgi:protein SCO1/2
MFRRHARIVEDSRPAPAPRETAAHNLSLAPDERIFAGDDRPSHYFRRVILGFAVIAAFCLAAGLGTAQPGPQSQRSPAEIVNILTWGREPIGGPFALTDHQGRARHDSDFQGKLMLVYFGFTFCPDICPTDLLSISQAVDLLGADGELVQPLFITVDPERDTAEHLAQYVSLFHPRLIGLTGEGDAIRRAADAYKVYYAKVKTGGADYTVDHTAFIYLMGAHGEYLGFFPPSTPAEKIADAIKQRLPKVLK